MFVKYSYGRIVDIKDQETTEKRENEDNHIDVDSYMIICKKCGLQHVIYRNEKRACCGDLIQSNEVS